MTAWKRRSILYGASNCLPGGLVLLAYALTLRVAVRDLTDTTSWLPGQDFLSVSLEGKPNSTNYLLNPINRSLVSAQTDNINCPFTIHLISYIIYDEVSVIAYETL